MFRFLDKDNKILSLEVIDKLACECWHVEEQKHYYAAPAKQYWIPNWYDVLGHAIEDLQYYTWKDSENHTRYSMAIRDQKQPIFDMNRVGGQIFANYSSSETYEEWQELNAFISTYVKFCYYLKTRGIKAEGMGW